LHKCAHSHLECLLGFDMDMGAIRELKWEGDFIIIKFIVRPIVN
jgi:hypothetical protein